MRIDPNAAETQVLPNLDLWSRLENHFISCANLVHMNVIGLRKEGCCMHADKSHNQQQYRRMGLTLMRLISREKSRSFLSESPVRSFEVTFLGGRPRLSKRTASFRTAAGSSTWGPSPAGGPSILLKALNGSRMFWKWVVVLNLAT